jgi:hypothetical protein
MKKLIPALLAATPFITLAEGAPGGLGGFIETIQGLATKVIPLIMVFATVVFLWGVLKILTAGGEEESLSEGKSYVMYGLIGLFIMSAVWGLVGIIGDTFGVKGANKINQGPTL